MRSISHRSARSPHEFRRWVRLSVATITSTALVGGAVVAAPPHPLNPLTQVAQAQEITTLLPADVSTAEGTLIDLALLAESGAIDEADLELLEAIQSEQAWPQDTGEEAATGTIDLELLQALNLNLNGVSLPLVNDGTNNGLLELGTDGVGALNSYANAPGLEGVRAAAGAVTEDGSLNLDPTTGEGSLDTTLHLTALAEQLGLSGITELAVNELSLTAGALATAVEKSGDTVDPQYTVADAQLTIGSDLVGEISTELQNTVTELETGVNDLLGGEGVVNSLLGVLGPVLELVASTDDPQITASVDLQDTLDSLLLEPLYEGTTPEESLVNIDLTSGEIIVNLENLHDGNLNELPANTELVSAAQLEEITQTVNELLGTLTDRIADALNEGLLDTQLTITLPDVSPLGLLPPGDITIDATLGGLLGTEGHAEPVIDGDDVLGVVGGLLNILTGVLQPIGGVIQEVLEGPVDGLVDTLLGTGGPVTSLLDGLSPLIEGVLGDVVSATVNSQTELEDGLRVSALDVSLLNLAGTELASLPLATSTVTSPSQDQIDDGVFAPSITTLDPNYGATAGGDTITIEGDNLVSTDPGTDEPVSAVTEVNFGGTTVTADDITANADGSITVTTPAVEAPGEVQVSVVTAAGTSNTLPFTYTDDTTAPVITPIADQDGTVGEEITPIVVEVDDEDADIVVAGLPDGLAYNDETGQIEGTPTEATPDGDPAEVTITASNEDGQSSEVTFEFTVNPGAEADEPAPSYDAVTAPAGEYTTSEVSYTDEVPEPEGTTYALADDFTVPEGWSVTIDETTGTITAAPAPAGADGADEEVLEVPVTVTYLDDDIENDSITAVFNLDTDADGTPDNEDDDDDGDGYTDDDEDEAGTDPKDPEDTPDTPGDNTPVITDIDDQTGIVGEEFGPLDIEVDDENATVTVDGLPEGLTYNDETGQIEGTPTEVTDGASTVTVTATNEAGASTETFELTINDADDEVPSIGGTPNEVEPTDEEQDTGLNLEDGTEDTEVTARDEDDQEIPVNVDDEGNISVTPGEDVDGPITIIVDDPALDEPIEVDVPVAGHEEGRDDDNSGGVETDVTVGSSDSWLSSIAGLFVGLLGIGGIFAGIMEFMHQNGLLGQAEDLWWLNITNR